MLKIAMSVLSLIAFPLMMSGCFGKSSSSPGSATSYSSSSNACNVSITVSGYTQTECIDWTSSVSSTAASTGCSAESGTSSTSGCSTSNVLGVCVVGSGSTSNYGTIYSVTYYSGGIYTTSTATSDCTTNYSGTFTAG